MRTIETERQFWAGIARQRGWYSEPFFVQVWLDSDEQIVDSVSFVGLDRDIIERDNA